MLEWIGIDNSTHTTDIVSVCTYLFLDTIISIKEEYAESGFLREDYQADLYIIHRYIDDILTNLVEFKDK